eukprot:gnl/MRDRNA2_/MRDRNA2_119415_c0_seq1.p1 gnl/MRDRNA2_/MRDRNA2_119415_c0~~gnl/MRDRNA2_/MRDRNA2_119415_c0_seq1.p1  ORF type:complete len:479 (-),score=84.16 gnl/MRDRNA2_/MRDRNA2_119415_c0_seq1:69-1505(-)
MGNCSKKAGAADVQQGYVDPDFPASSSSLRPTLPGREKIDQAYSFQVQWHRISKVIENGRLFRNIEPTGIIQGDVGDCWLLSAMAAIAEFPGYVESLFKLPPESTVPIEGAVPLQADGKYVIWIFDPKNMRWEEVSIDDRIPYKVGPQYLHKYGRNGKPYFSQPREGEAWCLLLEKAFAKFLGSYGNLDGGDQLFAWMCLTGSSELFSFRCGPYALNAAHEVGKEGRSLWCEYKMSVEDPRDPNSTKPTFSGKRYDDHQMIDMIYEWDKSNYVMGALIVADEGEKERETDGLVEMHAFSLLSVASVELDGKTEYMLLMRNPWGGKYEWKGDWSDKSDMWERYPQILEHLQPQRVPDGMFWMARKDFLRYFNYVCVCKKGMQEMRCSHHEYVQHLVQKMKRAFNSARRGIHVQRSLTPQTLCRDISNKSMHSGDGTDKPKTTPTIAENVRIQMETIKSESCREIKDGASKADVGELTSL